MNTICYQNEPMLIRVTRLRDVLEMKETDPEAITIRLQGMGWDNHPQMQLILIRPCGSVTMGIPFVIRFLEEQYSAVYYLRYQENDLLIVNYQMIDRADFQKELKEGRINLAALDAGQEVLVFAPELGFWETEEHGETVGHIAGADFGKDHPNARLKGIAINDYFTAEQSLQLIQALTEDEGENWDRRSAPFTQAEAEALEQSYRSLRLDTASVTVGAVLESASAVSNGLRLITTEKGLRALGFAPTDPTVINVSLTGEVDRETEEAIQRRLETIAARAGMEVYNRMENARENARRNRQIELVFLGIIVLFFAVSVSMQVSGASRRIRADKRMIGTLRAVGADEGELMGCYRLPVLAATVAGLLLALIIFTLMGVFYSNYFHTRHAAVTMPLMAVLAALCALCCMAGVKARLRQVLSKSVVENIREL